VFEIQARLRIIHPTGEEFAWLSNGTFNQATYVFFRNSQATIAGETGLFNVTVETGGTRYLPQKYMR